jgi:hypothetical protein
LCKPKSKKRRENLQLLPRNNLPLNAPNAIGFPQQHKLSVTANATALMLNADQRLCVP